MQSSNVSAAICLAQLLSFGAHAGRAVVLATVTAAWRKMMVFPSRLQPGPAVLCQTLLFNREVVNIRGIDCRRNSWYDRGLCFAPA